MKKIIGGALPLLVVLTLAFVAIGCPAQGEEARVEPELTPEELVERVVEAYGGVITFHVDMEMTRATQSLIHGETIGRSLQMRSYSRVDAINQRMGSMIMQTTIDPGPGDTEEVMESEMEMYWVDGLVYVNVPMGPDMAPIWMKKEMTWVCSLEQTIALLQVSEIDILGVEEVNGVESYLIKVTPDLAKLWELLGGEMIGQGLPRVRDIDLAAVFQEISMKKWIATDTFLVVKQQYFLTMALLEGMEENMSSITRFHRFNQPLTIELPPEAEGAVWGPGAAPPRRRR